jgi:FdhD protein
MSRSQDYSLTRWHDGQTETLVDPVAIEEPLQLIVDGHPLAVLMRTPGNDEELAMGFLLTEGIITTMAQVKRIDTEGKENHALVFLADGIVLDLARLTRHLFSASSCGLCGKANIEAITNNHPPVPDGPTFATDLLLRAPDLLRASQETFDTTGGLHASALFSREGELLVTREDVGRHNALDKVLGRAITDGLELSSCFLLLSGRASFELMQKALAGRIPLIAAISAPSSLAVEFAQASNQTLLAFLRPPSFNIYAHCERLEG